MKSTELSELEINIEGYSGPFDLLCSLSEHGKFRLTGIKISQLIKIYGMYLIKTRQAPADTLAAFFCMASALLLEKTRSLLPGNDEHEHEYDEAVRIENEQEFMHSLERYMSYRDSFTWLTDKLNHQSLLFKRENQKVNPVNEVVIEVESGGPKLLAETWQNIYSRHIEFKRDSIMLAEAEAHADWNGFGESEQEQIDERVSDIEDLLNENETLSFNELCRTGSALVTLLALLELCRMGKALIEQEELFSDVRIITKT